MLGLQCTQSAIRAAAASKSGQILKVQARAEQKINKGTIGGEGIEDHKKALTALKSVRESLKGSSRKVTLCLSPSLVYTVLVRLPKMHTGIKAAVRGELEAMLPDPIDTLNVHFTPLRSDAEGLRIAVNAVSADVIDEYAALCKDAGLRLGHVTTAALSLGGMLKHVDTFLLINIEDPEPSIVVFYGGHPVDELLLSSTAGKSVIKEAEALLEEYKEDGMTVQHVAVHGTKEVFEQIKDTFSSKRKASTKKKEMDRAVTVEHVLPNLKKTDLAWGGIIASSLGKGMDVRTNSARFSTAFIQTVLGLVFFGALGYFLWIVGGVQVQGMVREVLSVF
ncbi:MAG: pilus assembly protein PilM [Candidatus Peribacteraceae bacterium]|jgi:hypothetical protein|nr:pilus assembly protein PilM [Candidatus Peribacteraceae bacterium]